MKAQRIVLCAASPFFFNALSSDMKEKKRGVIRFFETVQSCDGASVRSLCTQPGVTLRNTMHCAFDWR